MSPDMFFEREGGLKRMGENWVHGGKLSTYYIRSRRRILLLTDTHMFRHR